MRKRISTVGFSCAVILALIVLSMPGCTPTTGTIDVDATLDGSTWTGSVDYTLTPTTGSPVSGTQVSDSFTVAPDTWTCAYVSGGPGIFVDITPSDSQSVAAGGTIAFTLNFESPQQVDASVEFDTWTINGMPVAPGWHVVYPGDWVDIEYKEHVSGEEDATVTVDQTAWLQVHNIGPWGEMEGEPVTLHCVNAPGAVKMDPSATKLYQQATVDGAPVDYCYELVLEYCEPVTLDVEVGWELVVCNNYTKTINWIGFPPMGTMILQDMDVMFDVPDAWDAVTFNLTGKACIDVGEGFEDTNPANDCADWCPTLTVTYLLPP